MAVSETVAPLQLVRSVAWVVAVAVFETVVSLQPAVVVEVEVVVATELAHLLLQAQLVVVEAAAVASCVVGAEVAQTPVPRELPL